MKSSTILVLVGVAAIGVLYYRFRTAPPAPVGTVGGLSPQPPGSLVTGTQQQSATWANYLNCDPFSTGDQGCF